MVNGAGKMGGDAIAEIVGIMFMSRTYAHMAHLKTGSYAAHKALNDFYDDIVGLCDDLAESAQGQYGKLNIPFKQLEGNVSDPAEAISKQLEMIKELGSNCEEDYLCNILQEVEKLYRSTLYKLTQLS